MSFFRKIEAHDMIGSIVVPQQTVERLVALQGEIIAVGEPEWCDDEDCKRPHHLTGVTLAKYRDLVWPPATKLRVHRIPSYVRPGAWVLLAPRSWVPTPERDVYAVQTDSILGVYSVALVANA